MKTKIYKNKFTALFITENSKKGAKNEKDNSKFSVSNNCVV